jgi:hypothetical protein
MHIRWSVGTAVAVLVALAFIVVFLYYGIGVVAAAAVIGMLVAGFIASYLARRWVDSHLASNYAGYDDQMHRPGFCGGCVSTRPTVLWPHIDCAPSFLDSRWFAPERGRRQPGAPAGAAACGAAEDERG